MNNFNQQSQQININAMFEQFSQKILTDLNNALDRKIENKISGIMNTINNDHTVMCDKIDKNTAMIKKLENDLNDLKKKEQPNNKDTLKRRRVDDINNENNSYSHLATNLTENDFEKKKKKQITIGSNISLKSKVESIESDKPITMYIGNLKQSITIKDMIELLDETKLKYKNQKII